METFASTAGEIQVLAAVEVSGTTLRLRQISVAPATTTGADPGYPVLRGIMQQIAGAACAQGFEVVEFEGERLTGASVGRIARVGRKTR